MDDVVKLPAGRPGTCALCGKTYPPGVQVVSIGQSDSGDQQLVHADPCMADSLAAGEGSLGWDRAYLSKVPTVFAPTVWIKDGRLRFMAPFNPQGFAQLKLIVGRQYHADPKPHWSFPTDRKDELLAIARGWTGLRVGSDVSALQIVRAGRQIEVSSDKVLLRYPYDEKVTDLVREIPGCRWSSENRAWTFPLEQLEVVLEAARGFPLDVRIDGSVLRQQQLEVQALTASSAAGSEQVIEYPGVGRLRGYQTEGVRFLTARGGRGLLGDDMGLGKTIQILAYARTIGVGSGPRALFVVPASVRLNWARETAKWLEIDPERILVCGITPKKRIRVPFRLVKAAGPLVDHVDVVIINYDVLGRWMKHLAGARFDLIAFDEAHYLQNSRSQRSRQARYLCHGLRTMHDLSGWLPRAWEIHVTQPKFAGDVVSVCLRKLDPKLKDDDGKPLVVEQTAAVPGAMHGRPQILAAPYKEARGLDGRLPDLDLAHPGIGSRILATGTPILNRPPGLWHLLHLIDPDAWGGRSGGYKAFTKRYMGGYVNHRGHWTLGDRATNTEELHRRLLGHYMARRRKADVLTELPPKTVNRVLLEPTLTELRAYHSLQDEIRAIRESYEDLKIQAAATEYEEDREEIFEEARRLLGEALGRATQLRQTLGVCKVPAVIRWLEQLIDAEEPVVMFAHHKGVQMLLIQHLTANKVPVGHVLGADGPMERQAAIDAFQAGKTRAIVCSIQAAGAGITLHRSSHTVHVERAWNPGVNDQAEDRTHRIGQIRACFSWYVDVPGTLDDQLHDLCDIKKRDQQLILDGRVIERSGSTMTQRAVLAHAIGLGPDDLEILDA